MSCSSAQCNQLARAHSTRSGCRPAAALLQCLACLPRLAALDLAGLACLGDACAASLACLPHLEALDLSGTACGDATLEVLTYGSRLHAWAAAACTAVPEQYLQWSRWVGGGAVRRPGAGARLGRGMLCCRLTC
jgi:hypothetical protein